LGKLRSRPVRPDGFAAGRAKSADPAPAAVLTRTLAALVHVHSRWQIALIRD
jgi:hypothetical protein